MVNVKLHGKLGAEFQDSWELEVSSAAEILRALDVQIPNFRKYITEKESQGHRYYVAVGDEKLKQEEQFHCKFHKDIKKVDILPVVGGGGPGALVFLGKMLIAAAVGAVTSLIVNKLFEPPDPQELRESNSYLFAGAENTESQGIPVPLGYGKLLIGGKTISAVNEYSDNVGAEILSKAVGGLANVQAWTFAAMALQDYNDMIMANYQMPKAVSDAMVDGKLDIALMFQNLDPQSKRSPFGRIFHKQKGSSDNLESAWQRVYDSIEEWGG